MKPQLKKKTKSHQSATYFVYGSTICRMKQLFLNGIVFASLFFVCVEKGISKTDLDIILVI